MAPTPAMRQYLSIKKAHPDAILFFRMGDFYEMFYEDALLASRVLEIALTSRQQDEKGAIPMCGVPFHAAETYIGRLLKAGHRVAICEQVEDPSKAKGLVKRRVVRVITPGTATEPSLLEGKEGNYLAGLLPGEGGMGLAWVDLSTGEFSATEARGERAWESLKDEWARLEPREVLLPEGAHDPLSGEDPGLGERPLIGRKPPYAFELQEAKALLTAQFGSIPTEGEGFPLALGASGALLGYLKETQGGALSHLRPLRLYFPQETMALDQVTQRNLELTRSGPEGKREDSLLWLLDRTETSMGGRMLKAWMLGPLTRASLIEERLEAVKEFFEGEELRRGLKETLKGVQDLERLMGRVCLEVAGARELRALSDSLRALPRIEALLQGRASRLLRETLSGWDNLEELRIEIDRALVEDPPVTLREGGLIREGYSEELDRLRAIAREGRGWVKEFEAKERERTGIPQLRVGYNKVFGYYIELTRRHAEKAPPGYIRRQTLTAAERFTTEELKRREEEILTASERANELEYSLFTELRSKIVPYTKRVQEEAGRLALLDVLASLADVAVSYRYARPKVNEGGSIRITAGRHPVLERSPAVELFVPNDTELDPKDKQIAIITGPNMAGKSTYIRQVALIVLMAQMGSFVPAERAEIGVVDRIFTRVGAHDRLMQGQSTFMVEMLETASILRGATPRSLIILDEIGRGTSTFDGVSIARAVLEHLHESPSCRAKTLFATHYHELAELAGSLPRAHNLTVAVKEWGEEIHFLRKVVPGSTDRSYGIQVARLAGLPPEVLERAKEVLSELALRSPEPPPARQLPLFAKDENPVVKELESLDPERLTPLEALNILSRLREMAREE